MTQAEDELYVWAKALEIKALMALAQCSAIEGDDRVYFKGVPVSPALAKAMSAAQAQKDLDRRVHNDKGPALVTLSPYDASGYSGMAYCAFIPDAGESTGAFEYTAPVHSTTFEPQPEVGGYGIPAAGR